jgi:hypothetical protein
MSKSKLREKKKQKKTASLCSFEEKKFLQNSCGQKMEIKTQFENHSVYICLSKKYSSGENIFCVLPHYTEWFIFDKIICS